MEQTVNKCNIWELVVNALPGGKTDLRNQLFYMTIEEVFEIKGRGTVITGRILSGSIQIGDKLEIGRCYHDVMGIELFKQIVDSAEFDDNCGILLRKNENFSDWGIESGASVSKAFETSGNLRVNWSQLLSSIKDLYGINVLKKELSSNIASIASLIDTIERIILNRVDHSQSQYYSQSQSIGNTSENPQQPIIETCGWDTTHPNNSSHSKENKTNKIINYTYITEMNIDKEKIHYAVGIDLGHGETSAALCPLQWDSPEAQWETPTDIEMGNNHKVIPSAITLLKDGRAFIGRKAFDPEILKQAKAHVCFKQRPQNIDGEPEKIMTRFMSEVYKLIRGNTSGILNDDNHVVFIATPSGWDTASQNTYKEMARKAGMPIYGVTKESRAAYIRGMSSPASGLSQNVRKGAIVFDMGSSTLDFTYLSDSIKRPIDYGYDCGASYIEKYMYEKKRKEEGVREFEERYPDLSACLLFEARNIKEEVYFKHGMKVKKNIHLDELVDDDDLDEVVRFLYQPNELNEELEADGYLKKIEDAMDDFVKNHINNAPINGVFLTGGASRMDFIIPLVAKNFGVQKELISRDQDPSLTISQGVAEVARMDLRTSGTEEGLATLISSIISENKVYHTFVNSFSHDLWDKVTDDLGDILVQFRDSPGDISLNALNTCLEETANESVREFLRSASKYAQNALETETKELTERVNAMVAIYNKQGAEIKTPRMNINIHISIQPQAITGIINTISEEIASNMKNTTRAWLTGAGAVFGLIGMAAGYLIGSLFSDSEEEKLEKAMSRELDQEKRASIFAEIEGRWQDICNEIAESIDIAIFRDKNIERALTKDVNKLLDDYKRELTQAKMLIE